MDEGDQKWRFKHQLSGKPNLNKRLFGTECIYTLPICKKEDSIGKSSTANRHEQFSGLDNIS